MEWNPAIFMTVRINRKYERKGFGRLPEAFFSEPFRRSSCTVTCMTGVQTALPCEIQSMVNHLKIVVDELTPPVRK